MSRPTACLLLACCLGAACAETPLRLSGSWEGEVQPDPRLPFMPWTLRVDASLAGPADATLVIATPAGELTAHLSRPSAETPWAWRLTPRALPAAALRDWLAPLLPVPAGIAPAGEVELAGGGTWDTQGAAGNVVISWSPAALEWPEQDLRVEQPRIEARIELADSTIAAITTTARWEALHWAAVDGGAGTIRASAGAGPTWSIESIELAAWRGRITLSSFEYDPSEPQIATTVTVEAVALEEIAEFFPQAVRAAAGHLSGVFELSWNETDGLRPGRGTLRVVGASPARVQLAPSPGLLSARLPEQIRVLPRWSGLLSKWSALDNPARQELVQLEMGEKSVRVDSLEVQLHPEGVGRPLSARVHLLGRPDPQAFVEQVNVTVNVTGPLQDLIELGLDQRARISAGR